MKRITKYNAKSAFGAAALNIKKNYRDYLFYICLIALPLAQFIVMYVMVNIDAFTMSFKTFDGEKLVWSGLENFKTVLYDITRLDQIKYGFINSIIYAAVQIVCGTGFGVVFSYYIYKNFFGAKFFRVMLFLPSILSAMVLISIYRYYVDKFLPAIINPESIGYLSDPETMFITVVIFNIIFCFGSCTLVFAGKMKDISPSVIESADLDGAGPLRQFVSIIVPQMIPTIGVYVVTTLTIMFTNQINLYAFFSKAADYKVYTIGYYIYNEVKKAGTSVAAFPYVSALGMLSSAITIPLVAFVRWIFKKIDPMEDKK